MVNIIYLFSFVETSRKFIIAMINLRGVSTKLNQYKVICVLMRVLMRQKRHSIFNKITKHVKLANSNWIESKWIVVGMSLFLYTVM